MTDQEIEPDAWMSYNGMGGAGLVPYLVRSRAEDSTNLTAGGPPPARDTDGWPQPLFSPETIREALKQASLDLEGYCSDHDEWIWKEDHQCLDSRSCDIWQPKDGHIWADFAKEVFSK